MYYNTDNAQVNGAIVNVSAPTIGELATFTVKVGGMVSAGQTIDSVTPALVASPSSRGAPFAINITNPISGTVAQVPAIACRTTSHQSS